MKYRNVHPDHLCEETGRTEKAVETMPVDLFTPPPISTRVSEVTFGRKLLGGKGLSSRFVARRRSSSAPLVRKAPPSTHMGHGAAQMCRKLLSQACFSLHSFLTLLFSHSGSLSVLQEKCLTTWSHMEE